MDKITLSEKAEEEMSEAIKVMAVSAFTEKKPKLNPFGIRCGIGWLQISTNC